MKYKIFLIILSLSFISACSSSEDRYIIEKAGKDDHIKNTNICRGCEKYSEYLECTQEAYDICKNDEHAYYEYWIAHKTGLSYLDYCFRKTCKWVITIEIPFQGF